MNPSLASLVERYRIAETADPETQESVAAELLQALANLHPAGTAPEFCQPEANGGVLITFTDGSSVTVTVDGGILLVDD